MIPTIFGRTVVHVVCDYASGDLASSEVLGAVSDHLSPSTRLIYTPALAFNTIHTGFVSAQLARLPLRRDRRVLYINCAPRGDKKERREKNAGEGLVYGVLKNGTIVVAVNSGYSLSWLRDDFVCLYEANVPAFGSQFRSRDNFPVMVGWAAAGWFKRWLRGRMLGTQLDPLAVIPAPPDSVVGYVDNFRNVKTSLHAQDVLTADFAPGDTVIVTISGISQPATVTGGSFEVAHGTLAFSRGSSGPIEQRFWEVFLRGGHAAELFNNPAPGAAVLVERSTS